MPRGRPGVGVVNLLISDTGESDIRGGVLTALQVGCSVLYIDTTHQPGRHKMSAMKNALVDLALVARQAGDDRLDRKITREQHAVILRDI